MERSPQAGLWGACEHPRYGPSAFSHYDSRSSAYAAYQQYNQLELGLEAGHLTRALVNDNPRSH